MLSTNIRQEQENMEHSQKSKQPIEDADLRERIHDFMKKYPIGVLSTVTPSGSPHAAVIYFSVDDKLTLRFTTKKGTRKHKNIQHDSHVMFVCFDAKSQTEVQVAGKATLITNTDEENLAFDGMLQASLHASKEGVPPLNKLDTGEFEAYRIEPSKITMEVYGRPDSGGYEMFETIDF
jgi:uncharacterized pyridoxamine 5'-phosphate oxidase family protein